MQHKMIFVWKTHKLTRLAWSYRLTALFLKYWGRWGVQCREWVYIGRFRRGSMSTVTSSGTCEGGWLCPEIPDVCNRQPLLWRKRCQLYFSLTEETWKSSGAHQSAIVPLKDFRMLNFCRPWTAPSLLQWNLCITYLYTTLHTGMFLQTQIAYWITSPYNVHPQITYTGWLSQGNIIWRFHLYQVLSYEAQEQRAIPNQVPKFWHNKVLTLTTYHLPIAC